MKNRNHNKRVSLVSAVATNVNTAKPNGTKLINQQNLLLCAVTGLFPASPQVEEKQDLVVVVAVPVFHSACRNS